MKSAARGARRALFAGLEAVGGFDAIAASGWRRERLLILCYHGISLHDEHEWDSHLFMSPRFLRRRFESLRAAGCNVLPLGEGVRRLKEGTLPPRSVVLTFDDGFHDFLGAGMPLLEEFGFPATNYVSTYYCLNQRPIPALALRYVLWRARAGSLGRGALPGIDRDVDLSRGEERSWVVSRVLTPAAVAAGREAQHELIGEVAARVGVDWAEIQDRRLFHLMTPDEVAQSSRRGADIQLHTHRHRTPGDREAFVGEIRENRAHLERLTGKPAVHFCYPSGNVEPAFLPWLREAGVESATTGFAALARASDEPLLLPRYVDTMAQTPTQFAAWLCGAGSILSRHRSVAKD